MLSAMFALALTFAQQGEAAASPPSAPAAESASARRARLRAEADAKVECRDVTPTGSNVPKSVCATAAEWRRIRQESLEATREMNERTREAQTRR